MGSAEQLVYRLARRLAHEVPQGDVDAAYEASGYAASADEFRYPKRLPNPAIVKRVFPDQQRFEVLEQALRHFCHAGRVWLMRPANAADALIGTDLDQVQSTVGIGVLAVANRLAALPAIQTEFDVGNLHIRRLSSSEYGGGDMAYPTIKLNLIIRTVEIVSGHHPAVLQLNRAWIAQVPGAGIVTQDQLGSPGFAIIF